VAVAVIRRALAPGPLSLKTHPEMFLRTHGNLQGKTGRDHDEENDHPFHNIL
jgi:hypothetical protein